MCDTWKEVMRLNLPGGYVATFNTLFTDTRDQMSDSLAPSWMATSQHRISVYDTNTMYLGDPLMSVRVSKTIGNAIYTAMKHFTIPDQVTDWLDNTLAAITANGTMTQNCGYHGEIKEAQQ